MTRLVAVQPSSGMGNQLFMTAALLHYANKHGHRPVFWARYDPQVHLDSVFDIHAMFPHIPVLSEAERTSLPWQEVVANDPFTFEDLPSHANKNVKLVGYFQAHAYVPHNFPTPPPPHRLSTELIAAPWHRTFFLHVRRGDYLHPANAHHNVELTEYWRTCLSLFPNGKSSSFRSIGTEMSEMEAGLTCFVVSDDMAWCHQHLKEAIGHAVFDRFKWVWCPPECTDVETLFWMTMCDAGGICANSTFSWWAAWYLKRRHDAAQIYMPRVWGLAPLPPARDLYPPWALQR